VLAAEAGCSEVTGSNEELGAGGSDPSLYLPINKRKVIL